LQGRAKASFFWQVAGKATFGTTTHFEGYFVYDRITFQTELRSTEEL
jgi:hypothetical protein